MCSVSASCENWTFLCVLVTTSSKVVWDKELFTCPVVSIVTNLENMPVSSLPTCDIIKGWHREVSGELTLNTGLKSRIVTQQSIINSPNAAETVAVVAVALSSEEQHVYWPSEVYPWLGLTGGGDLVSQNVSVCQACNSYDLFIFNLYLDF